MPFAFPVRAPAAGLSAPHLATLTATQQLNVTAYQPADATEISGGGKFTIALVQWKRLLAIDSMTKRLSIDLTSEGVQESSIELTELQQPLTTEEETGDLGSIESLDTVKFAEAADDSGPPESASSSAAKSASQHTADVTQPVLIEAFWNQSPFFSVAILQTPSTEEAVRLVLAVGCTALLMLLVARSRRRPTEGSPVEHIQTKLDQQLLAQSLVPRSQQIIATPEGCSTHSPRYGLLTTTSMYRQARCQLSQSPDNIELFSRNSKTATASRGRRSPLKSTPEQQLIQEQPLVQEKPRCRWTGDRSGVHTTDVHSSSTFRTSQLWNRDGKGRLTRGPEFDSAHKGDERTVSESVF